MVRPLVVLGAGLTGLSAAYHARKAGRACLLFEKEERPGGLVRSHKAGGFTFDYTGHLLHMGQQRTRDLVLEELGLASEMEPVARDSWVYSHGRFTRAPFQANLYGLPADVVRRCLEGALRAHRALPGLGPVRASRNFEDFNLEAFGEGIYREFMEPYNTKLWGVHPSRMGTDFMGRFVPKPSLTQIFAGALVPEGQPMGYNAHFVYPRRGGIERLAEAFARRVDVHTGLEALEIDPTARTVRFADGSRVDYGRLVSTLPLKTLVARLRGVPKELRRAAGRLRAASVLNVNLGIGGRNVSSKQWVYVPEPDLPFYRVGFYHNFASSLAPKGGSSVYAEMSYSEERPLDKASAPKRVRRGLERMGILRRDERVDVEWVADIADAYVTYDVHRSEAVARIQDWLRSKGILSVGRWGRWEYSAMEDAIWQGAEAVR